MNWDGFTLTKSMMVLKEEMLSGLGTKNWWSIEGEEGPKKTSEGPAQTLN